MLSRITNFKLKATRHRVLDIGDERYSSPFFFEPNYNARIPSSIVENGEEKDELIYGDWVIGKMIENFGEFKNMLVKK